MELSVQQLRMLREVATQGTIAAAADRLGYTASAVSQQLSATERATGVAVLERVGRNVLLTDAGRELVRHADTVLHQLEMAQAAIERVQNEVAGAVRVGFIESVSASLLVPLTRRLDLDHPDLELRTIGIDGFMPYEMLRAGELDAGFAVGYPSAPSLLPDGIAQEVVCIDRFHLAVPSDHPSAGKRKVDLASMSDELFIGPSITDSCGLVVVDACRLKGFEPDTAHVVDNYRTSLELVAAGLGVSMVPDLGLRSVPDGVTVLDLKTPVSRTIELAYRKSSGERPVVRALVEATMAVANEHGLERPTR